MQDVGIDDKRYADKALGQSPARPLDAAGPRKVQPGQTPSQALGLTMTSLQGTKHRPRQRGASMVEFVLVALPLLLVGLVVIEIGDALMTRQVLRLALHEAMRAGAVQHAEPRVMAAAFESALTPLFVPAGSYASPQARMLASHARLLNQTGLPLWRLDMLGPPMTAFADFGRPDTQHGGRSSIANDYQAEQHVRAQERWPAVGLPGKGTQSGLTIFDANVLHVRVTYLRRPLTPLTATLLKAAAFATSDAARPALAAGLLPLTLDARMTMQSDPVAWASRVVSAGTATRVQE